MKNLPKIRTLYVFMCLVLGALLMTSFSVAQEKSDEELKKKYGPILGKYEFNTGDMGGGAFTLNYYIEGKELWVDSGDGRPAIMQPIEGKTFVFQAEDPEAGMFDISFQKDDQGAYTINRVANANMGMELEGHKIK